MKTALDSSVLLLILRRQTGWEHWKKLLTAASAQGPLVISPVVFVECSVGFASTEEALRHFDSIGIVYDSISPESAWLAGRTFVQYRRQGGARTQLLPDFLIAAHAMCQADRLAAIDRGYLRAYFPKLRRLD
ncbi:MAG: type II toxin-antitoxin system VapC family toxin [Verrucomicrobiae bacterium]|nr:type II toxin-antitoxin system VapC family toxin [Verrucomicrobiae bacterium]